MMIASGLTTRELTGLAVIVMAMAVPFIGGAIACWYDNRALRRGLKRDIFDNLDSAANNGYFEPGEHYFGMTAEELAYDLACYASGFEDLKTLELLPYVQQWMTRRGL